MKTRMSAWVTFSLIIGCGAPDEQGNQVNAAVTREPIANGRFDTSGDYKPVVVVDGVEGCTGTVIGCLHVLTAGHCVCNRVIENGVAYIKQNTCAPPQVEVLFGQRAFLPTESRRGEASVPSSLWIEENVAEEVVVRSTADIAIVKLDAAIPDWVKPASLGIEPPSVDEELTLVGYGAAVCNTDIGAGFRRFGSAITM